MAPLPAGAVAAAVVGGGDTRGAVDHSGDEVFFWPSGWVFLCLA